MAARAALGRALVASGATFVGLGVATMVVSSVSMGVARVVVTQNKKKTAVTCYVCDGHKKVTCDVCGGEKAIRYHPFKTMPLSHNRMPLTACAMCSASGRQICLNCLGEGTVNPTITIDAAEVLS
eukprot:GHUV01010538.1.p1 GENE.GHUV01010538.1~~GHUV01010538.1.p1  ORF type:complete len:125 (+),score=27.35 GHUV01010538.1:175-549(+)